MPIKYDKNMLKDGTCQQKNNKTSMDASNRVSQRTQKKTFLDIATLIRSIQRAEGHSGCFKMGMANCGQMDCKWRAFCL
jgi:hypothetical protein